MVNVQSLRLAEWAWLGRVPYGQALRLQEHVRDQVAEGRAADTLLLLEHDPVITLGRSADPANVISSPEDLRKSGIAVIRTARGGDVFHRDAKAPANSRVEHARHFFIDDAHDEHVAHILRCAAHQRAQRETGVFVRGSLHGALLGAAKSGPLHAGVADVH